MTAHPEKDQTLPASRTLWPFVLPGFGNRSFVAGAARRYRNSGKGQALVEMAIVVPFFLLIIVGGIIDFGFAFSNLITLQQIANEAAQYAAEGKVSGAVPSDAAVIQLVDARKPAWWAGTITASVTSGTTSDAGAATLRTVSLSYISPMYTPFYQVFLNSVLSLNGLSLSARATFQVPQR